MNEDRITPAINLRDELPEMSSEEFQRRLYAWFEDRGLMSDLRAHLRTQMISVFKEKGVGRVVSNSSISPKLQALNLLIAEFLLQQGYHYSLSVFSAEVPLTNVLPELPGYAFNNKHQLKKWQFLEKDMWDILDTLGIQPYTEEAHNIFNAYYSGTNNDSLLTSIVRMLHAIHRRSLQNADSNQPISASTNWRKDIYETLTSHNINTQIINKILKTISDIIETEQTRLRNEAREEFLKLEAQLQAHFQTVVKGHEERAAELQRSLNHDLSKNEEMAKNFERQQIQHRERLHKLITREQNVSKREAEIKEKDAFIKAQEFLIKTKLDTLQEQQKSLAVLQERLENEVQQSKNVMRSDVNLLKNIENECQVCPVSDRKETSGNKIKEDKSEQDEIKMSVMHLQDENVALKALNADQKLQIRELSRRATLLMHELEDTQNAFHSLQARNHGIITVPPLTSPVLVNRVIGGGAGEEGLRNSQRAYQQPSSFFNTTETNRRRSASRKLFAHNSSSSDDLSPTNELLREARERLKRLEQESEEIDRNYKLYQSTLNSGFKVFNSSLKVPSTLIPQSAFTTSFNDGNLFNIPMNSKQINDNKSECKEQKHSDASSDIWEGAGTSGISFSGAPTSDEKSDSHQEDKDSAEN